MAYKTPSSAESEPEELEAWLDSYDDADAATPAPDEVRRVRWSEHVGFLEDYWAAGQHCSIFAASDGGKTHLIVNLLPLWQRYPVLFFKAKPKDATLGRLGHTVKEFPGSGARLKYEIRRRTAPNSPAWVRDPEWYVLQLPTYKWSGRRQNPELERARRLAGQAMDRAYREGTWVLVFDEVKVLAGREDPHLNLPAPMTIVWEQGRSQPVTVIAGTQSPSLAPPPMYDQARHIYLGRITDEYRQDRLGEIGGASKRIRAILPTLRAREFLYVFTGRERGERDQMYVIQAPPP